MKTILTGIKPTGGPHIGNLLGAILPALRTVEENPRDRFLFFIADYHALTSLKDAKLFKQYTYEVAATWLAFGLDPKKVIFYRQSDIPEVFELCWILNCHTPKGDMNRAHAYKAVVAENEAKGEDPDHGVNVGLFTYPILMSADILLFDTQVVPVGKDQVQHVEIARSIAQRFNQYYGETLIAPEVKIQKETGIIPGLDGRKMSKSYQNTIPIFLPEKKLQKLINRIATDSTPPEAPKDPNTSSLFQLYSLFASPQELIELEKNYARGISWGEVKAKLFKLINNFVESPRSKYEALMQRPQDMDEILQEGAAKARVIAAQTLKRVKAACGII